MSDQTDVKTEAQSETTILTDIQNEFRELDNAVKTLDPLPTPKEAELGELCKVPSKGQFDQCELVDDDTADLIEFVSKNSEDYNET